MFSRNSFLRKPEAADCPGPCATPRIETREHGLSGVLAPKTLFLYYTILDYTILYYTTLYYTVLYYTILYYTTLYYTILYYTYIILVQVTAVVTARICAFANNQYAIEHALGDFRLDRMTAQAIRCSQSCLCVPSLGSGGGDKDHLTGC